MAEIKEKTLDVITIGRCCIDLYGEQVGGRLEDMISFAKYIGGCPTNIAAGSARLGLKSALISRVGDEHMGRFVREQLTREGVDISHLIVDPERHTAYAILGIEDKKTFPLIFIRENCADSALCPDDIDESFIATATAIVVTGTHFSRPNLDAASKTAICYAKKHGVKVIFDVDYRPVLWGLTGHGGGESRFIANDAVTRHLATILPDCDVIVGTEEELHIAGGSTDTLQTIRNIREQSAALIVCKRGPMGCVLFPGAIPDDIEKGVRGPGFPIEVYNVLGAGDSFMSGFLRGYLRDLPLEECCRFANACGAITVSRHGCTPASPTWTELSFFLENGSKHIRLREDRALEQLHWATTRWGNWPEVCALAMDHRIQLEDMAARHKAGGDKISRFKELLFEAGEKGAQGRSSRGYLIDGRYAQDTLDKATKTGAWIARPIELPKAIPLTFEEGECVGVTLRQWPRTHVVKCLCYYHPNDSDMLRAAQEQRLLQVQEAARASSHELLIEIISSQTGLPIDVGTVPAVMQRLYGLGIFPDWWKLESPEKPDGWKPIEALVESNDPHCRGVLMLGLDAPEEKIMETIEWAAASPVCKGFAVGRTLFSAVAEKWFAGKINDVEVIDKVARNYERLILCWEGVRRSALVRKK